jgi:prepilin-type N-terminal cleavage/methylation domain-containing protein
MVFMKKSAFTLVEIAVVVAIIATLIAGITQSSTLIKTARVAAARSATANSVVPRIENLVAWYETSTRQSFLSSQAIDETQISTWFDISPLSIVGNKNSLIRSVSTDVTYEESAINKVPSVQFSGSGFLSLSTFYQGSLSQATIFLVFEPFSQNYLL